MPSDQPQRTKSDAETLCREVGVDPNKRSPSLDEIRDLMLHVAKAHWKALDNDPPDDTSWDRLSSAHQDHFRAQVRQIYRVRNNQLKSTDLDAVLRERQLDRQDFDIQIDAARESMTKGWYAAARAELRGAIVILDGMEKRRGTLETTLPKGASWCGPLWMREIAQPCDGSCGCGKNPKITLVEKDGVIVRRGEIDGVIVEGPSS